MIREMRNRGMKMTEIAKELGMSRPTVRKYIKSRDRLNTARRNVYPSWRGSNRT